MAKVKYIKHVTVATVGTKVQLPAAKTEQVIIRALKANTGNMFVGDVNVSATAGHQLAAGESITLPVEDASELYIDAAVANEGVSVIAI